VAKTTITDTLYLNNGSLASGTLEIILATSFETIDGDLVPKNVIWAPITNGEVSVDLWPNDTSVPAGTQYKVKYHLKPSGQSQTEYWTVPTSATAVSIGSIRTVATPTTYSLGITNLVFAALGDLAYGGASGLGTTLAGNATTTPKFLMQTGTGLVSAAPVWGVIAPTHLAASPGEGEVLTITSGVMNWAASAGGGTHAILSATHSDSTASAVARGDMITGQGAVPTWKALSGGILSSIMQMGANEPGWSAYTLAAPGAVGAVLYSDGTNWTRETAPTISAANLTSFPTLNQNTTGTAAGLAAAYVDWTAGSGGASILNKPSTFAPAAHNLLSASHGDTAAASAVLGAILYANATPAWASLAGDTSDTRKFLRTLSVAGVAQAPAWDTVTKSDVGLGSVENTALSTWAGSSAITTVGTLSSGSIPWSLLSSVPSTFAPAAHDLLSTAHGDTTGAAVSRGALIAGIGATPKWVALAAGTQNYALVMGANEPTWGVLPVAGGGSGATTLAGASIVLGSANLTTVGRLAKVSAAGTITEHTAVLGDLLYGDATPAWASLSGDTSNVRKFLRTLSVTGTAQAPAWDTVTKTDVGLSAVENTALSTWAGSSAITTVGTLSAGTVPWARLSDVPSYQASDADLTAIAGISVARGSLITGQGVTPAWAGLAAGTQNYALIMGANEPGWSIVPVAGGGTGANTLAGAGIVVGSANLTTAGRLVSVSAAGAVTEIAAVLGNIIYGDATPAFVALAPNTVATKKYLSMLGTGTVGAVPSWDQPASTELSDSAGLVRGAAALDTAGYVPFVTSAGSLTIDKTAGGQLFWDATNHLLGAGTNTPPARLSAAGNRSIAAWTTVGTGLDVAAATYTDTSTAGASTVAVRTANSMGAPTFASTNAITVTDAFTLYVPKPIAGTNTTITRANSAYFEGNIGIGTTAPTGIFTTSGISSNATGVADLIGSTRYAANRLTTSFTDSAASTSQVGTYIDLLTDPNGTWNKTSIALQIENVRPATNANNIGSLVGAQFAVRSLGAGTVSGLYGFLGTASAGSGSGNVTTLQGGTFIASNLGASTITTASGILGEVWNTSTGVIGTATPFYADIQNNHASGNISGDATYFKAGDLTNAGTITGTTYGLNIGDITTGTQTGGAYSIYASDANAPSYFAGSVGIATTTPTLAKLQVSGNVKEKMMASIFTDPQGPPRPAPVEDKSGKAIWEPEYVPSVGYSDGFGNFHPGNTLYFPVEDTCLALVQRFKAAGKAARIEYRQYITGGGYRWTTRIPWLVFEIPIKNQTEVLTLAMLAGFFTNIWTEALEQWRKELPGTPRNAAAVDTEAFRMAMALLDGAIAEKSA